MIKLIKLNFQSLIHTDRENANAAQAKFSCNVSKKHQHTRTKSDRTKTRRHEKKNISNQFSLFLFSSRIYMKTAVL